MFSWCCFRTHVSTLLLGATSAAITSSRVRSRSVLSRHNALINCDLTCLPDNANFFAFVRSPTLFFRLFISYLLLLYFPFSPRQDKQARNGERGFTNSNWTYHTTFYICFWSRVRGKRAEKHLIVRSRERLMILYHTSLRAARNE